MPPQQLLRPEKLPFRLHIEGVRTRATIDGIQGVVDSYVHHGIDTRFVERVVERSYACLSGGHASVFVPEGDCVAAAGRSRECGS